MEDDYEEFSDEEVDYERLYRDSQAAIHRSKSNQFDSKALQDELLNYVDSLDQKKASDGSSLIKVPSNFNSIVESMNREDITSTKTGEKPWSQYLLLDSLNSEYDTEYNGRYAHVFDDTADEKISRGLAQIQLLDRQLQEATRKNAKHSANTTDTSGDLSPRPEEDGEDPTFVTAGKRRSAEPSPRLSSSRYGNADSEKLRFKPTTKKATGKPRETAEEAEQKRRLDLLISDLSDDVDLEQRLGPYQDPELEQQNKRVDEQLAQFGRLDLLLNQDDPLGDVNGDEAAEAQRHVVASASNATKRDYLAEQRRDREKRERAQRIDKLLDAVTSQPIRYEDLLEESPRASLHDSLHDSPRTTRSARSARSRCAATPCTTATMATMGTVEDPLEVPSPGAVNPDRPITAGDIRELLHVLSAQSHTSRSSTAAPPSPSFPASSRDGCEGFAPGNGSDSNSHDTSSYLSTGGDLQLRPVDKEAVRALVLQYKRDVEALGRVRRCSQMRRLNSAGAAAGPGPSVVGWSRPVTADSSRADAASDGDRGSPDVSGKGPLVDRRSQGSLERSSSASALSGKLLDLHEEAPQSVINMAHPAVSRATNPGAAGVPSQPLRTPPKKQSAVAGVGPGPSPSAACAGSPLPVPPAASHPRSPLPLSPASLRLRGSDSGDGGLSLDGWEGKGPPGDPLPVGHRAYKSLRLAPHSPNPAMGALVGGSVGADLLAAARRRGGVSSTAASSLPVLAPQSVFRAFHGDGAGDAAGFFVDIAQLRPSPRGTQRRTGASSSSTAGSSGSAVAGVAGTVQLGDQRRSLRASNILNSMTGAALSSDNNNSTSNKSSGSSKGTGSSMRI